MRCLQHELILSEVQGQAPLPRERPAGLAHKFAGGRDRSRSAIVAVLGHVGEDVRVTPAPPTASAGERWCLLVMVGPMMAQRCGDGIGGVAVEVGFRAVVAAGGAGVGVAHGFLDVFQWNVGGAGFGDEGVAQAVRADPVGGGDADGAAGHPAHLQRPSHRHARQAPSDRRRGQRPAGAGERFGVHEPDPGVDVVGGRRTACPLDSWRLGGPVVLVVRVQFGPHVVAVARRASPTFEKSLPSVSSSSL